MINLILVQPSFRKYPETPAFIKWSFTANVKINGSINGLACQCQKHDFGNLKVILSKKMFPINGYFDIVANVTPEYPETSILIKLHIWCQRN